MSHSPIAPVLISAATKDAPTSSANATPTKGSAETCSCPVVANVGVCPTQSSQEGAAIWSHP